MKAEGLRWILRMEQTLEPPENLCKKNYANENINAYDLEEKWQTECGVFPSWYYCWYGIMLELTLRGASKEEERKQVMEVKRSSEERNTFSWCLHEERHCLKNVVWAWLMETSIRNLSLKKKNDKSEKSILWMAAITMARPVLRSFGCWRNPDCEMKKHYHVTLLWDGYWVLLIFIFKNVMNMKAMYWDSISWTQKVFLNV